MKFDVFFSICQTDVDGHMPSERVMFENFFDQLDLADQLGYETAWVAETHLSCEVQKTGTQPVIPHFKGEIGLNTDILQLAHMAFARTKNIALGSAIRNILCNGGPIAHAEAVRTFSALREFTAREDRDLHLGFAAGRFFFYKRPYGIAPRHAIEKTAWSVIKGKVFLEATEIFLRLLKGETLSSKDIRHHVLREKDFRDGKDWEKVLAVSGEDGKEIPIRPFFNFERVGIIPRETSLRSLKLVIGSHDPEAQILANQYMPVGVFNLSITPPALIEATHDRMREHFHRSGGGWKRWMMPRTAMVFLDETPGWSPEARSQRARKAASTAWENYWRAMEGTLDPSKVTDAVANTLAGDPDELARQIREKYHAEDRLMLWFDFNNHDNEAVKSSMRIFRERVMPQLGAQ
jgi:alkanesulfonate monooxygenase SsuD/methylene tetrahydromethanopterin reductase-like flavin-dependent oxidoreductase (luciferase family)